jgi:hypothetical protein
MAFYVRYVGGTAVFWAALIAEGIVLYCYQYTDIAYLLFNIIGCGSVMVIAIVLQTILPAGPKPQKGNSQ